MKQPYNTPIAVVAEATTAILSSSTPKTGKVQFGVRVENLTPVDIIL